MKMGLFSLFLIVVLATLRAASADVAVAINLPGFKCLNSQSIGREFEKLVAARRENVVQ